MAKLILTQDQKTTSFEIDGVLTIGRHRDNALKLSEPKASRQHARVVPSGLQVMIEDLNSSNGTSVNGKKITRCELRHGDTIQIGKTRIVFESSKNEDTLPEKNRSDDPLVGRKLGGYEILGLLGQGGMGAVYKAKQISMDRIVALKVLKKELSGNREFVKGFLREARVAGKLSHPGILQVHDFGEDEGTIFFSMEFVDGESVHDQLKREGKLGIERSIEIALAVCEALVYAAKYNVVHQDIKPHNIMVDSHGNVKLADLGLATITGRNDSRRKSNKVMGTPNYMAPEQAQCKDIDARTDLYALGSTLFHLTTGRPPFRGPNSLSIITQHLTQARPDPREYDVTIPAELATLIMRLMAIAPTDRPANAAEVLGELQRIQKQRKSTPSKQRIAGQIRHERVKFSAPAIAYSPPVTVQRRPSSQRIQTSDESLNENAAEVTIASRESTRNGNRTRKSFQLTNYLWVIVVIVFLFIFARFAIPLLNRPIAVQPSNHLDEKPDTFTPPEQAPIVEHIRPQSATPSVPTPPATELVSKPNDREIENAYALALEQRDRALNSNNFRGALLAMDEFERIYPQSTQLSRLQAERRETEQIIQAALEQMLNQAETAAGNANYRLAGTYATRVMSAQPDSLHAARARELMDRIDRQVRPRFQALMDQASAALKQDKLDKAIASLEAGVSELSGTQWAEPLGQRQLQLLLTDKFLNDCEQARKAITQKNRFPQIEIGSQARPQKATLMGISGLSLDLELGGARLMFGIRKLQSESLQKLVAGLKMEHDHLGLANLSAVLGYEVLASSAIQKAMLDPGQAETAMLQAPTLLKSGKMLVYDFKKWQHQTDWEAPYGAWSTQNETYLLESPEGGDTTLRVPDFGGVGTRIAFEFEPRQTGSDFYISMTFGTINNGITVLFNASGFTLQSNYLNPVAKNGNWQKGKTQVQLQIAQDSVALNLNGKPAEYLKFPDAGKIRGTIAFQVREAMAAFDNIVIQLP